MVENLIEYDENRIDFSSKETNSKLNIYFNQSIEAQRRYTNESFLFFNNIKNLRTYNISLKTILTWKIPVRRRSKNAFYFEDKWDWYNFYIRYSVSSGSNIWINHEKYENEKWHLTIEELQYYINWYNKAYNILRDFNKKLETELQKIETDKKIESL